MGLASALSTALTGLTAAETRSTSSVTILANSVDRRLQSLASRVCHASSCKPKALVRAPRQMPAVPIRARLAWACKSRPSRPTLRRARFKSAAIRPTWRSRATAFSSSKHRRAKSSTRETAPLRPNSQDQFSPRPATSFWATDVDRHFHIHTFSLAPLNIPLVLRVAQATQNVFFQGTLTPTGAIADTAEILDSAILCDGNSTSPMTIAPWSRVQAPDVSATTLSRQRSRIADRRLQLQGRLSRRQR